MSEKKDERIKISQNYHIKQENAINQATKSSEYLFIIDAVRFSYDVLVDIILN
jgi:hypothetical protein